MHGRMAPMVLLRMLSAVLLVAALALGAARAADIAPGDRAESFVLGPGHEAEFTFSGARGGTFSVAVKARKDGSLDPDLGLYDPDDVPVDLNSLLARGPGEVSLDAFTFDRTGTWRLAIIGRDGTHGGFALSTKGKPPRGGRLVGQQVDAGGTADHSFPGGPGVEVSIKVKPRTKGGNVQVVDLLDPGGVTVPGFADGLVAKGGGVKGKLALAGSLGDYTLRVGGSTAPVLYDVAIKTKFPRAAKQRLFLPGLPSVEVLHDLVYADLAADGTLDDTVLVDTRLAAEYAAFHIPGAVHRDLAELEGFEGGLPWPLDARLVFYCYGLG